MTNKPNKTNKLVAVYARTASASKVDKGQIKIQLSKIRKFAKEMGYTIVREYKDDGWSGISLKRPQLDQLRQDAKKKVWEAVLAYDPDRISRNLSHHELIREELKGAGVDLLYVIMPPTEADEDKIIYKIRDLFAGYEIMRLVERPRLGRLCKAKEKIKIK